MILAKKILFESKALISVLGCFIKFLEYIYILQPFSSKLNFNKITKFFNQIPILSGKNRIKNISRYK